MRGVLLPALVAVLALAWGYVDVNVDPVVYYAPGGGGTFKHNGQTVIPTDVMRVWGSTDAAVVDVNIYEISSSTLLDSNTVPVVNGTYEYNVDLNSVYQILLGLRSGNPAGLVVEVNTGSETNTAIVSLYLFPFVSADLNCGKSGNTFYCGTEIAELNAVCTGALPASSLASCRCVLHPAGGTSGTDLVIEDNTTFTIQYDFNILAYPAFHCEANEVAYPPGSRIPEYLVTFVPATDYVASLDTIPPTVAIVDHKVDGNVVSVTFNAGDDRALTGTCEVSVLSGNTVVETNTVPCSEQNYTYTFTAPSDGEYNIVVTATDLAGNEGNDSVTVTVDTTPPDVNIELNTTPVNGWYTTPVEVNVTCADNLTDCNVTLYVDGNEVNVPYVIDAPGYHEVNAVAVDGAGNVETNTMDVNVDLAPPELNVDYRLVWTDGNVEARLSPGHYFVFTLACTDDVGTGAQELNISGYVVPQSADGNYWVALPPEGNYPYTATCTDVAGRGTVVDGNLVVDYNVLFYLDVNEPVAGKYYDTNTVPVDINAPDYVDVNVEVDGNAVEGNAVPPLADGCYTLRAWYAYPYVSREANVDFCVDTVPPEVNITGKSVSGKTVTVTFTVSEANPGTCEVSVLSGNTVVETNTVPCSEQNYTYTFTAPSDGEYNIVVTATDLAGNKGNGSVAVTVDTTPPEITITYPSDGAHTDTTVTARWTVTGATEVYVRMDDGSWVADSDGSRSYTLDGGVHTFCVRAVDAYGNEDTKCVDFVVDVPEETTTSTTGTSSSSGGWTVEQQEENNEPDDEYAMRFRHALREMGVEYTTFREENVEEKGGKVDVKALERKFRLRFREVHPDTVVKKYVVETEDGKKTYYLVVREGVKGRVAEYFEGDVKVYSQWIVNVLHGSTLAIFDSPGSYWYVADDVGVPLEVLGPLEEKKKEKEEKKAEVSKVEEQGAEEEKGETSPATGYVLVGQQPEYVAVALIIIVLAVLFLRARRQ